MILKLYLQITQVQNSLGGGMRMDCTALSVKLRNLLGQLNGKRAARSSDMQKLHNVALAHLSIWYIYFFLLCMQNDFKRFIFDFIHARHLDLGKIYFCSPNNTPPRIHFSESCGSLLEPWATPPKLPWGWRSSVVSLTIFSKFLLRS